LVKYGEKRKTKTLTSCGLEVKFDDSDIYKTRFRKLLQLRNYYGVFTHLKKIASYEKQKSWV
jgi:hypothetical protein